MNTSTQRAGCQLAALTLLSVSTLFGAGAPTGPTQPGGTPPVPSGPVIIVPELVRITNTEAQAVPTTDQDNPARQSFQVRMLVNMVNGQMDETVTLAVIPNNKRLVIESYSTRLTHPNNQLGVVDLKANNVDHDLLATPTVVNYTTHTRGAGVTRIYADPNSAVTARVIRLGASTGTLNGYISIVGHFVDLK